MRYMVKVQVQGKSQYTFEDIADLLALAREQGVPDDARFDFESVVTQGKVASFSWGVNEESDD